MKTKITELLHIEHPIIQGGMQWLSRAEFVASVSNAGGLGLISAATFPSKKELIEEIHRTRELTDKPFGVNITILPGVGQKDKAIQYFEAVIEENVLVVETSGRSPESFVPELKKAGVKLIHKVPSIRFAKKAESIGADAVIIVGYECGGHPGMDDITSLVLTPKAADTLSIPVISGGGFADARGLIAALALGAEGIVMGTRFLATTDCLAHPKFKEWMIQAEETDTVIIERSIQNTARVMKNVTAEKVLEMEARGATMEEILKVIGSGVRRRCYIEGDLDGGTISMGQCVGLIYDIKSIKDLITDIITESEIVLDRLQNIRRN